MDFQSVFDTPFFLGSMQSDLNKPGSPAAGPPAAEPVVKRMINNTMSTPFQDPDRHCYRVPFSKYRADGKLRPSAAMKCAACKDYNSHVLDLGVCKACGARRIGF